MQNQQVGQKMWKTLLQFHGSGKQSEVFWSAVIDKLKEERMPMLYSNLINTKGVMIDDMTFGIEVPNGLNSFGRSVIEKPENMAELRKLVSIECKKDMRIKLIDDKKETSNQFQGMKFADSQDSNTRKRRRSYIKFGCKYKRKFKHCK